MDKIRVEQVTAELDGNGETYTVRLDLTVKDYYTNESSYPVNSAVERIRLSQAGAHVPDGAYTLRYNYNGKLEQTNVRIQYGGLVSAN